MLNTQEVAEIFRREYTIIGNQEGIPMERAVELFGEAAVKFAVDLRPKHDTWNGFVVGDYTMMYLTYNGAKFAAGYNNVKEFEECIRRKANRQYNVVAFRPRMKTEEKGKKGRIV